MLPKINMVAEQYPQLKADTLFVNLQNQLVALENQLADRREFYNSSATNFNTAIETIPTNFVAMVKSCKEMDLSRLLESKGKMSQYNSDLIHQFSRN